MYKVAFYAMNSKGYFVLKKFIEKFNSDSIVYIISCEDMNIKNDYYKKIQALAKKSKIKFFNRHENIKDIESSFNGYKFAIGWRWIIKNDTNLIVFHDSILPKYRGFSPLVNSLINYEEMIGVSALLANKEYDKGDIVSQKSLEISYPIKIEEVINKIQPLYFYLVNEVYQKIEQGISLQINKQNEDNATYSIWLDKKDYFIDWKNWSANKIKRFVDAVGYPYDGAKVYLDGKIINFIDINVMNDVVIENRARHIGKVIFIKNGFPVVVCQKGLIQLVDIRDDKNNPIALNLRSRFN